MYTNEQIEQYYDKTYVHYKTHWKIDDAQALHYGLWYNNTNSFVKALINTNDKVIELGGINENSYLLDAGCGIGGTLNYIASTTNAKGIGITVSKKQVIMAASIAEKMGHSLKVKFEQQDFCNTHFKEGTFDVCYAIESMCHAERKEKFLSEMNRILKPGGKLLIFDYFIPAKHKNNIEANILLTKWLHLWAVHSIETDADFEQMANNNGFVVSSSINVNNLGKKSVIRMYILCLLGAVPNWLYNLYKKGSIFANTHYKSGIYQYKAFKKGYWDYRIWVLEKA